MNRFVVIGLGKFGSSVAEALYARGHDVVVLDTDREAIDDIAPRVSRAVVGDARQTHTLEEVGAEAADAAIVSIGRDITVSVLATMALKDLGVENVYVKVTSEKHARLMTRIGVTETVFPERESGFNLASRLSEESVLNYVQMGRNLGVQELAVPNEWRGHSLRELKVRPRFGVHVVGIRDPRTGKTSVPPDPDEKLKATDTLLIAGSDESLETIAEMAAGE